MERAEATTLPHQDRADGSMCLSGLMQSCHKRNAVPQRMGYEAVRRIVQPDRENNRQIHNQVAWDTRWLLFWPK
jgi:hypothetical protein